MVLLLPHRILLLGGAGEGEGVVLGGVVPAAVSGGGVVLVLLPARGGGVGRGARNRHSESDLAVTAFTVQVQAHFLAGGL